MDNEPTGQPEPKMEALPKTLHDALPEAARDLVGIKGVGDTVPFIVQKAAKETKTKMPLPVLVYYDFVQDAVRRGTYVDPSEAIAGDIMIWERGATGQYWSGIVLESGGGAGTVAASVPFGSDADTVVVALNVNVPEYDATWHTIAAVRL